MPQFRHGQVTDHAPDVPWPLPYGDGGGGRLAASPFAVPGSSLGWVALGLLAAVLLARRGHEFRSTAVTGLGLGPLMWVVLHDRARYADRMAAPLALEAGLDHGGPFEGHPGRADAVAARFRSRPGSTLVLVAVEDTTSAQHGEHGPWRR